MSIQMNRLITSVLMLMVCVYLSACSEKESEKAAKKEWLIISKPSPIMASEPIIQKKTNENPNQNPKDELTQPLAEQPQSQLQPPVSSKVQPGLQATEKSTDALKPSMSFSASTGLSKASIKKEPNEVVLPDNGYGVLPYKTASPLVMQSPVVKAILQKAQGQLQIIEFFNYPCPACAHIDPLLQKWLETKPKQVQFIRIPVIFYTHWVLFSKIYYAIEALAQKNHIKNTNAIHADFFKMAQNNFNITNNIPAVQAFFVKKALLKPQSEAAFVAFLDSFDPGIDYQFAYAIRTIPTFVIQGKTGIHSTAPDIAGNEKNIFMVLDYWIAQEMKRLNQVP